MAAVATRDIMTALTATFMSPDATTRKQAEDLLLQVSRQPAEVLCALPRGTLDPWCP